MGKMTEQEAIKILGQHDVNFYWTSGEHEGEAIPPDQLTDAFEVAIGAIVRELQSIKVTFGSGNGLVEGGLEIEISTVNAQPSVQPDISDKDDWIPVNKKLPDNDNAVLITHSQGVTKAWWNGRYWSNGMTKRFKTVTAWMPMPEPYKSEGDS